MKATHFLSHSRMFNAHLAFEKTVHDFERLLRIERVRFNQALIMICILVEDGTLKPSDIARALNTSRSNVSHALRNLERHGLVSRDEADHDARAVLVRLTPAGQAKADRILQIFEYEEKKLTGGLQSAQA